MNMSLEKNETLHHNTLSTHDAMAIWDQYLNIPQQCSFSIQL